MKHVELFVGLKIPDTTAITTFHTIEKMGYKDFKKIKREIYYKFGIEADEEKFAKKIGKVDILVNANKNKFTTKLEKEDGAVHILVKDIGDKSEGLLHTLQQRLGLKEIKNMEKGILWTLYTEQKTAEEIAKNLLYNANYQTYELV